MQKNNKIQLDKIKFKFKFKDNKKDNSCKIKLEKINTNNLVVENDLNQCTNLKLEHSLSARNLLFQNKLIKEPKIIEKDINDDSKNNNKKEEKQEKEEKIKLEVKNEKKEIKKIEERKEIKKNDEKKKIKKKDKKENKNKE